MRKYQKTVSYAQGEAIYNGLYENNYELDECIEGVLLDSLFFDLGENTLYLGGTKLRKYLMLLEQHETCWTSNYLLIMTDDADEYYGTMEKLRECEEEFETEQA